jgi:hypothetical protein
LETLKKEDGTEEYSDLDFGAKQIQNVKSSLKNEYSELLQLQQRIEKLNLMSQSLE